MEQENTPSNTFFPTARSLFSVEVLGKLLETEYGLSHVRCQLIKAMICDTYRVTTMSASYILRIYRYNWRTIAQINSESDRFIKQMLDNIRALEKQIEIGFVTQ